MASKDRHVTGPSWPHSRSTVVLIVFLAIGAFFLVTEHRAHLFGVLPFALLLLCLLLHTFMHGGHGGDHAGQGNDANHQHRGDA